MSFMLIIQFLVLTTVVSGVLIFFLKKTLFDSTQGAVNRLNRETEEVRAKQSELNTKIKEASEELNKRRAEADELVAKMKFQADEEARIERDKILKKAREDGEEIIAKADRTKDDIRKVLEKEMLLKTVDVTALILKEVLSARALKSFNDDLITEFLDSLQKVDMRMIKGDVEAVDIVTAFPLEEKFQTRLQAMIKEKIGRPLAIHAAQDKSIISGIVLRFGGLALNGSLASMLKDKGVDVKDRLEKGLLNLEEAVPS